MKRLGVRVDRVAARRPVPPPSPGLVAVDVSRLTAVQQARVATLHERALAGGVSGLTDAELDEAIDLWALLGAPGAEDD